MFSILFFFNDTATTEIYTLSLHDALPICGYSDGVRALLRAPGGKVTGLVGPVPQLGVAPAGLEIALEAALGPYLQAVVVQTLADAHACLRYLQEAKLGKAMVLWLDKERMHDEGDDTQFQAEEATLQRFLAAKVALKEHVLGFAWRYVQSEPRYSALFRRLLRGIVIARN